MISITFHFGIILGTFEALIALYATVFLMRSKGASNGYVTLGLVRQLQMVFGAAALIAIFDLVARTVTSLQIMELNLYWVQGLLALAYLFGIFMHAFAITRDEKRLPLTLALFGFVAVAASLFWLKTNVWDGFKPVIANPDLVVLLHILWIISGLAWIVSEWLRRDRVNEIKGALDVAVARSWGFFLAGQLLTLFGARFDLTLFYTIGCLIALPNLFLLYLVADTDFVSIDYYKKPFLYLKERIIVRMILTLSILIIVALELINFATLYIVKAELTQAKTTYFHQVIAEAQKNIHQSFDANRQMLLRVLANSTKDSSEYFIGISIFNQVGQLKGLNKLVILSSTKVPVMTVTPTRLQFSYEADAETSFDDLLARAQKKGYVYAFQQRSKKSVIATRILRADGTLAYYVVAYFNADDVFAGLKDLAFEQNGELQVLGNDYSLIYTTRAHPTLRDEYERERYIDVSEVDPMTGLVVLVRQPEVDAFSGLQKAQYNSFFFTTFSIVAFLIIAFFFLRIIEAPLRKLQMGARAIGAGDLNHTIDIKEKNEFFDLARAFNFMVQDLKKLQQEQLKNEQVLSITRMSVGLNHEINNPLAAILMSNQMVLKMAKSLESQVGDDIQKKLALIGETCHKTDEEAKRIKKIIEDIQNINEPIIEDYVDGTKMMKVKFD